MDPNSYLGKRKEEEERKSSSMRHTEAYSRQAPDSAKQPSVSMPGHKPATGYIPKPKAVPVGNGAVQKPVMGKLSLTGKRFFGQILIDHWVIRIGNEQKNISFGKKETRFDLPAGTYHVTAYTPYLGMRCNKISADIEIRPKSVTRLHYKTVFDVFKKGELEIS